MIVTALLYCRCFKWLSAPGKDIFEEHDDLTGAGSPRGFFPPFLSRTDTDSRWESRTKKRRSMQPIRTRARQTNTSQSSSVQAHIQRVPVRIDMRLVGCVVLKRVLDQLDGDSGKEK